MRTARPVGGARQIGQRRHVGEAVSHDRELHELRPRAEQTAQPVGGVGRHAVEVVERADDARPVTALQQRFGGPVLHVHELGAERPGLLEQGHARRLVAVVAPALPHRAQRHDDRQSPAGQGPGHVEVADAVEAQLHQVGAVDLVPVVPQLGHGVGRHGGAEQCGWHERKNAPSTRGRRGAWSRRSRWMVITRDREPLRCANTNTSACGRPRPAGGRRSGGTTCRQAAG